MKQEMMGGSGFSWTICKSFATHFRKITTPVSHHSVFTGRMPFLPPNQQHQNTEGKVVDLKQQKPKSSLNFNDKHVR